MVLFVIDAIIACIFGLRLAKARLSETRGSNALTRTMRDVTSNAIYKTTSTFCLIASIPILLIGLIFKCAYACIPTVGVAIFAIVIAFKQQNNKQRIKDARVVTKGTLKAAEASAETVASVGAGVAAGVATGGNVAAMKMASAAGKQVGGAAGSLAGDFANSMTDVEAPEIRKIEIQDPAAFLEACQKAGISTAGKDLSAVAEHVIDCAPTYLIEQHADMPKEELAKLVMLGGK